MYDELIRALRKVDRPGTVCTGSDRPLTMPGLVVDGLGSLRLPLGKTQARQLIKLCRQAPYGKGTQTVVDTDVRRVWELDPGHFQLTNPKWEQLIASIVDDVKQQFGLEDRRLTAHLYKLLVYEQGSFFLPHRDGEKLDRMVATLVVALPSVHVGGELIVRHDGRQHEILFAGAASGHELSYAGFYADCQHEVRPLRSGYRLSLTYNMTLAKPRGRQGIGAPSYGPVAAVIGELLDNWRGESDSQKLAVTLDHRYTQDGLTVDKLKGIDRARAQVLFEAAERVNCVAHLAQVTLWQHGSAEGGFDDYSYGRGRGYGRSYDEEEDETDSDYEMGEIFDESLSANHWSDRQGRTVRLGEIPLDEDEIVADSALDDADPSREDFEGFTGNAGMTLERWYHRAAVVIWPEEQHFAMLCGAGTDAAIGGLEPMVKRLKRASKVRQAAQREECLAFAAAIIDSWQPDHEMRVLDETDAIDRDVFPALLCDLDDPVLLRRFVSQIMPRDGEIRLDKFFLEFCKLHGWGSFASELKRVVETTNAATIARNAGLLKMLCRQRDKNSDRIALCRRLAEYTVEALQVFDARPPDNDGWVKPVDRAALLCSLVDAILAIDAPKPLSRMIDHALNSDDKYDLTGAHLAAIFALESRLTRLPAPDQVITHWLATCQRKLEERTAQAPRKPADYRRIHALSCSCSDCRELCRFLANPDRRQHRFSVRKDRRRHLHEIIDGDRCDLTHITERSGRPYTLVCTKTTASYDRARKIQNRDLRNLSRITVLGQRIG